MNPHAPIDESQPTGQAATTRQWFIQVDGQGYGPFTDQTLWDYMREGRVTAQSLISKSPSLPFHPVSADPSLMNWIAQIPGNKEKSSTSNFGEPALKKSVFMVMAEIRSGQGMDFLRTLQSLGQVERIGDTLWLLQAAATADQLRNILSQPLNADDRLFILDSFENRMSWFNIGSDMDRRIRALWEIER